MMREQRTNNKKVTFGARAAQHCCSCAYIMKKLLQNAVSGRISPAGKEKIEKIEKSFEIGAKVTPL